MARRPWLRWTWRIGAGVSVLAIGGIGLAAVSLYHHMGVALPELNGTIETAAAPGRVEIIRDAAGMPDIESEDREGAAFGLGFVHAQERFFQMDIARHLASGRLAELFGPAILPIDRRFRAHRLQAVAEAALQRLAPAQVRVLDAYVAGVNAGLRALKTRPFEYAVLGAKPAPWSRTDSLLSVLSMYLLLQDSEGDQDYNTAALYKALPPDLAAFLSPPGSADWDAPMQGAPLPDPKLPPIASFEAPPAAEHADDEARDWRYRGSNAWAVAGWRRGGGPALVANDMHLLFGMPNTFFRARMHAKAFSLCGLTLPGFPALVVGSNGHIAWGFTNTAGEWSDLIRLRRGLSPGTYMTSAGERSLSEVYEILHVKGGQDETLVVQETQWGPVLHRGPDNAAYAVQWVAHAPEAVNLGLLDLERAHSVAEALQTAPLIGLPEENLVVGDDKGAIGWTIAGLIPDRGARPGPVPLSSDAPGAGWRGWLAAGDYPKLADPQDGLIWSANNRIGDGETMRAMGRGYYILGARAKQIRDSLHEAKDFSVSRMLALQHDDRAIFLGRWQVLLLDVLKSAAKHDARMQEALLTAQNWGGRADTGSAGYRLVREFRRATDRLAFAPFIETVQRQAPDFVFDRVGNQRESALWQLVRVRPDNLLNHKIHSWDDLLLQAAHEAVGEIAGRDRAISRAQWGDANRLSMRHPMSPFIPLLGFLTDMPSVRLAGDENMPLSQQAAQGPVMRMVAIPGRDDESVLELAGGNAGNPRSPYYGAGQDEWVAGAPTKLAPGAPAYRLVLTPPGHSPQGS